MYTKSSHDLLEFNLNFKVTRKVKKGFLGLRSTPEDFVILNDGEDDDDDDDKNDAEMFIL